MEGDENRDRGSGSFGRARKLYFQAGVAGNVFDAGAGAYASATVDDGPAGEIEIVIFFQLHICIDGTSSYEQEHIEALEQGSDCVPLRQLGARIIVIFFYFCLLKCIVFLNCV